MSTLDEVVKEYLDKQMPLEKLTLLIPRDFKSIKITPMLNDNLDVDDIYDEDKEQIITSYGQIKVLRTSLVEGPTLIDDTMQLTVNEKVNEVRYK